MPTEADDTLSASGDSPISGGLALQEADDQLSSTGDAPAVGGASLQQDNDQVLLRFDQDLDFYYFAGLLIDQDSDFAYYAGGGIIENDCDFLYSTDGTCERDCDFDYQVGTLIDQDMDFRYAVYPPLVEQTPDPGYPWANYGETDSFDHPLATAPQTEPTYTGSFDMGWKYNEASLTLKATVSGMWINSNGAVQYVPGGQNGLDFSTMPDQFVTTWTESAQATWVHTITDPTGYYHPDNPNSPWQDVMNPNSIAGMEVDNLLVLNVSPQTANLLNINRTVYDNVPGKIMSATTNWGGLETNFSGFGTAFTSRYDDKTLSYQLNWKGTCQSQLLFATGQTMKTVRSTRSKGIVYSQDVMIEICKTYNVAYNLNYLPDNFPVPLMHRQNGRPIDWLQALLDVSFASWIMVDGTTWTPYLPAFGIPSAFTYDLSDNHVQQELLERSQHVIVNDVTAVMSVEAGGGQQDFQCKEFKQYTVNFNPPISGVHWSAITQQGGVFSDFECYSGGAVVAVRDPRPAFLDPASGILDGGSPITFALPLYVSGALNNIDMIKFTWGNLPGASSSITGGFGHIVFMGNAGQDQNLFGAPPIVGGGNAWDPQPGLRARARNRSSARMYGNRHIELPPNPLLATRIWALIHAVRYLQRAARQYDGATFRVPYNPMLFPGVSVGVKDRWGNTLQRVLTKVEQSASNSIMKRYTSFTGFVYNAFDLETLGPRGQLDHLYPGFTGQQVQTLATLIP